MDNLESTEITPKGLLTLCQLRLTYLNIGKVISYIGLNSYGNEGALLVARHLPGLQWLSIYENELGWEGVATLASSLTKLDTLWINNNKEIGPGASQLGRLPILKDLYAGTYEFMEMAPG